MAKGRIKLKPSVKRGSHLPTGKGWRLARPGGNRALKASLLKTFRSAGPAIRDFPDRAVTLALRRQAVQKSGRSSALAADQKRAG
jgi:hypothetical protein